MSYLIVACILSCHMQKISHQRQLDGWNGINSGRSQMRKKGKKLCQAYEEKVIIYDFLEDENTKHQP